MAESEAQQNAEPAKKKAISVKLLLIMGGIMIAEAGAVALFLGMGRPAQGQAADAARLEVDDEERTQEIQIVDERFQNLRTGRVWYWDCAVYVKVKNKNADEVSQRLEQHKAEVQQAISQIIARAEHAQLKEPEHQTLRRAVTVYLDRLFEYDAEGERIIEAVLIPKCRGKPGDF